MHKLRIHAALLTVALIYGANYTIAKGVMPAYVQPFGLIMIRVVCAAAFFLLTGLLLKPQPLQNRADFGRLFLCAAFGVAINQLLFFKGLSLTSPSHASVLMVTTPILVLLLAALLLKERIRLHRWLGILLGAVGAGLLISYGKTADKGASVLGDLCIVLNATSYSLYLVLVKPLMQRYHALTVSKWTFLLGALLVIPFGWQDLTRVEWAQLPGWVWLSITFIVLGVTVLAYLLNAWTLKHVSPGIVGSYVYVQPVCALTIALLAGKDALTVPKAGFILLIFVGVYLASRK